MSSKACEVVVTREQFPIRGGSFRISRGSKTHSEVVLVTLVCGAISGRGECVPYARYGETLDSVVAQIEAQAGAIGEGMSRQALQQVMPAGAARNALDCALWDLAARQSGQRVWQLAGLEAPTAQVTAYTLSLDEPDAMRKAASEHADRPLLKLKLAGEGDVARVAAVAEGAPNARIIVDANEGWSEAEYLSMVPQLVELGVAMIEQPLPAGADEALARLPRPIPICADESCHDSGTLAELRGRYDMVNIKLDKTGGLTEALQMRKTAQRMRFDIMVGCMVASSLAMAPATLVASDASIVDLDGPLLLAVDRQPALDYSDYKVAPPTAQLWG